MAFGTFLGPIVTNRRIIGRSTDSFRKFYKVVCMNLQSVGWFFSGMKTLQVCQIVSFNDQFHLYQLLVAVSSR